MSALPETSSSPREALDDAIRPALVDGPCYVTFSGGRDSSAVLAAATELAHREGHEPPIPVTRAYPDLPEADESKWQRAVLDHLGLREWVRLEFRNDETDLLGDAAREGLRTRGLLWPPALQAHSTMFEHLRGGSLLTGEGGDAVLGPRRVTPITVMRRRRRLDRRLLRGLALAAVPRSARCRMAVRMADHTIQHRWLQPPAKQRHVELAARDATAEPLRYSSATWLITRRRSFATISHNHAAVAAEYGIRASDPLLNPGFVAALARTGGFGGFGGRTDTMRAVFAGILPPAVLSRSTKASFNRAHTGEATREFARSWDGRGVDEELVDVERLRGVWLSDQPTMATGVLLHRAWMAAEGLGGV